MAFKNKTDLGNHVRFAVNTKGSGQRKTPTAIELLSKTETAPAVADPTTLKTTGAASKGLRGLQKHSIKTKI
jgi:hypothetical protein